MVLLEVRQISKKFLELHANQPVVALKDIVFNLEEREILAISGENSSGKSTLLSILAGATRPSAGNLYFKNQQLEYRDYAFRSQHIRMAIFVRDKLFDDQQNIFSFLEEILILHAFPEEKIAERIYEILELVEIPDFLAEQEISSLNHNNFIRLCFARALILKPEILLIDELLANLDFNFLLEIVNLISKIHKAMPIAIIIVTPNLSIIKHLCDKVIFLEKGVIADYGTTYKVFMHSKSNYVHKLINAYFKVPLTIEHWHYDSIDQEAHQEYLEQQAQFQELEEKRILESTNALSGLETIDEKILIHPEPIVDNGDKIDQLLEKSKK